MKVKIGETYYDSHDEPIMVVLDEDDKKNISLMGDQKNYCSFPYGMAPNKMRIFMGLKPITTGSKNMKSIIEWKNIKDVKPKLDYGWLLAVLKPVNFKECEEQNMPIDDWIQQYGFEKVWLNGIRFWGCRDKDDYRDDVTDRVIYWADIPKVPSYKEV